MKLDPKTFNASVHKVTLKGSPVEIVGFRIGRFDSYAYYYVPGCTGINAPLEDFEVAPVVDTKVLVSDDQKIWFPRHFAHFDEEGQICTWDDGRTSFTNTDGSTCAWNYWKLK